MVFNIEVGGTLVSFAKVAEAIKDSGADVVGIEEAQGHIPRLARLLGWPYYSTRCQIVSKYPLIDPPGGRGVYLFVEPAPGKVVAMMNVHLPSDPYGPDWVRDGKSAAQVIALEKSVRLPAIQSQLAALPSLLAHKIPVFLTGDFNSPSFLDWTPAAVDTRTYDNGKKPWPPIALEWPVSKAVVDAGFRDSFRDIYPDPVANPGLTWWAKKPHVSVADENFGPLDVQDRIDYVYAAGPSVTTASRIVGEVGGPEVSVSVSPWPSDHRGVVSSFDITPATPPVFVAVGQRLVNIGENLKVIFHAPGGPNESVAIARTTASPSAPPLAEQPTGAGAPTDGTLTFATSRFAPGHYRVSLLDADGTVLSHTFFWTKATADPPAGLHGEARLPGGTADRGALAQHARRALGLGRRLQPWGQSQRRLLLAVGLHVRLDRRPPHPRSHAAVLWLRPAALAAGPRQVQRLPAARRRLLRHRPRRVQSGEAGEVGPVRPPGQKDDRCPARQASFTAEPAAARVDGLGVGSLGGGRYAARTALVTAGKRGRHETSASAQTDLRSSAPNPGNDCCARVFRGALGVRPHLPDQPRLASLGQRGGARPVSAWRP